MPITFDTLKDLFKRDKEVISKLKEKPKPNEIAMNETPRLDYNELERLRKEAIMKQPFAQSSNLMHAGQWISPSNSPGLRPSPYIPTTRDVNDFSDMEKIVEITNMLINAGFKDVSSSVLAEAQRRLRMLTLRGSEPETIKQPKKKLDL